MNSNNVCLLFYYRLFAMLILVFSTFSNSAPSSELQSLTVAVSNQSYPYEFANNEGKPDGLVVDYWRLWSKKQNITVKFKLLDWPSTIAAVKKGDIQVHAGLGQLPNREKFLSFTPKFFTQKSYIYTHKQLVNVHDFKSITPYAIGVVSNTTHAYTLKKEHPELTLKYYPSRHLLYKAALNKDILAFADLEHSSGGFSQFEQLDTQFPNVNRIKFQEVNYGAAVKKENSTLLNIINQGFAKISFTERNSIERKWLGIEKERDSLLLTFASDLSPYMAMSPSGKAQGLWVDLWRLWSEQTGQKVEFIGSDLQHAVEMVTREKADVMIAYPESENTPSGLLSAWELYDVNSRVFINKKIKPNINSLHQLINSNIGVFATAPYKYIVKQKFPELNVHTFHHIDDMIAAAESGKIVAMIGSVDLLSVKLINSNLQSSFYTLDLPVFHSSVYSLVNKSNKILADMIKRGFEKIPVNKMRDIEKQWRPDALELYFDKNHRKLRLDQNEMAWIKQHTLINVGVTKNWQPIEYADKNNNVFGINKDVLDIISRRTGLNFNYVIYDDWEQLYSALQHKDIDLAGGAAFTKERQQQFNFSKNYWSMPWVVIHDKALGQQQNLAAFFGKKIAIVKGYNMANLLTKEYPEISLQLVATPKDGLRALQQGVVDGMIEPIITASELLKNESLIHLMMSVTSELKQFASQNENHFIIRKDQPELKMIFNKAIDSISVDERQSIYDKWFTINLKTGLDKDLVIKIAAQVLFIVVLVIGFIMFWNRRLYQEVKHRKALEQQMKHMATHDNLTGLANRSLLKEQLTNLIEIHKRQHLKLALLFIDIDGFKVVNDTYGHDVGDELLLQLAQRFNQCVRKSDSLVRFGGDEFVVVLTGLHRGKEAAFIAEKILSAVKTPFKLTEVTTCVGCSIGISIYPDDGDTDIELVKVADTLMYQVKNLGKNNFAFNE